MVKVVGIIVGTLRKPYSVLMTILRNHSDQSPVIFEDSKKQTERSIDLPAGVRLAQYVNADEHVYNENTQKHTFSLYLKGGFETHRTDQFSRKGGPGHFCLMPKDSYSAWDVVGKQQFFHVYFDDSYIKQLALKVFDVDPRRVELPELSFAQSEALEAICRHTLLSWDWQSPESVLGVEQSLQTLMVTLLKSVGLADKNKTGRLVSGLSPVVKGRLLEFIDANHTRQILLSELAEQARLSEFHLAKMFKVSFAETPQQLIMRKRVESVKLELDQASSAHSLAELALKAGFSSQSHMGRAFKKYSGVTPGQYLRCK